MLGPPGGSLFGQPAETLIATAEDLALWDEAADCAIVVAILQMAGALGMRVIAEGVETEAQRKFLRDSGCHEFQGHLHAPALDSLSFEKRLQLACPGPGAAAEARRVRLVGG